MTDIARLDRYWKELIIAWSHLHVPGITRGRENVFKAHSTGHPLKGGGIQGVKGHTWNRPNGTPGRAGGVRKTYKKSKTKNKKNISS